MYRGIISIAMADPFLLLKAFGRPWFKGCIARTRIILFLAVC